MEPEPEPLDHGGADQNLRPELQKILDGTRVGLTLRDRAVQSLRGAQLQWLPFDLDNHRDAIPEDYWVDDLGDRRRRALTAAVACLFTARLNRLAPVAPPLLMANACELLRTALLADQSAREAVVADAAAAGAALADEMHKQRYLLCAGSSRLSLAEQHRQASVLSELEAQPRYSALLRLAGLRAANVVPSGGWQVGERIDLCVVVRALGPEIDPESAVVATAPARVDTATGEVKFDTETLTLKLDAEPAVIQFEFAFAGADVADMTAPRFGKAAKPVLWSPYPQTKRATVQIELDLKTADISSATKHAAVAGTHGKTKLLGMARHKMGAARAKAVQMRRGSVELQFAEDGRQTAVLSAFFEHVAPEKPREEMIQGMLEARAKHGIVSLSQFMELCEELEQQYECNPIEVWEQMVHESTPPASLVFEYSFDFLKLDAPTIDWTNVRGNCTPDTGRWSFFDDNRQLFRVLAHYLLPCNFEITSQDRSVREAELRAELDRVAKSLGVGDDLMEDILRNFSGNEAAALRYLRQAEHERIQRLRSATDEVEVASTLHATNSGSSSESDSVHATDSAQVDAVDWLLEDFALKYGVPVTYRKLTELLELATEFSVSVPFLMRLKTTLQMVAANADALLPAETKLFEDLKGHISRALLRCFRAYQGFFDHKSPNCAALVSLAVKLLQTTGDPGQWQEKLFHALSQNPLRLMHAMVVKNGKPLGELSADAQRWAPPREPLSAETLIEICDAVQQDIELNDTEFRFLFDQQAAPIVEHSVKQHIRCIWQMAEIFMESVKADEELLRSESPMQLYMALNNLLVFMYEVAPSAAETLAEMDPDRLFKTMIMSQIEQEYALAQLMTDRMIEADNWIPLETSSYTVISDVTLHATYQHTSKNAKFNALAWSKLPLLQKGTLDKKGARETSGFKPRWFELRGHHLVYFAGEKHIGKIKGNINILNANGVGKSTESGNELQIVMRGDGGRTYRLVAKSQDDRDVWISALSLARDESLQELEQQTSEQDRGSVPSGTVVDVEESRVDKYGNAHVRCARPWAGWLSVAGLDGTPLLNPVPQEDGPFHSQSAHDLVLMMVQRIHPLVSRWKLPKIASLVCQVIWHYCGRMEEMCCAELSALIEKHGQVQFAPKPQQPPPPGRTRFATIAALETAISGLETAVSSMMPNKVGNSPAAGTVLQPPSDWFVKLSNIHYLIEEGTVAFCDGIKAIDDLMGEDEFEIFQEAVLVCREPCRHNLGNPLDQLVDFHSDTMSTIITTTLAGLPEEGARERWWSDLLDFLDEVLDIPAQRTHELLFRMILKRCGDGFSRALEAVLVGDMPVHGIHSLSEKQELLQQCLQDVSKFFHASGQGLSDHMLDKNMSIHSRLGTLVSYHCYDNMQLMAQIQACSGHSLSEQEDASRSLALLVLGTRADDPEVEGFLKSEEEAGREHKRRCGTLPSPRFEQLMHLWGSQCKLEDSVEKARETLGKGAQPRRSAASTGFIAAQQEGEAHVLACLCEYLSGVDPLVIASDIAKANISCDDAPAEKARQAAYTGMLTAIISSTLRPHVGRYIVTKNATVRQGVELSTEQKDKLTRGEVILVKDIQELPDGTVRAGFAVEQDLVWTTATKNDGQVLLQRIPPDELTRENCELLKRSLLSSRMMSKRQRTLSRTMSVGTSTLDAESTGQPAANHSTSVLATMIDIDPPVAVVWYFNASDHAVQSNDVWSPFNFTECQKIERAFQAKAKSLPLSGGTAKFGRSGEMIYILNSVTQSEFDYTGWSKLPLLQKGTLDKKGARETDGFKPRWFELRGHHLVYFAGKNQSDNMKGNINILNANGVGKSTESGNELQIVMRGDGGRTYRLVAKSQDDRDVWISALSLAHDESLQELEASRQRRLKRSSFELPGTDASQHRHWLQQNLFMDAVLASAQRAQTLEEQLIRLSNDCDPLYSRTSFPGEEYDMWKPREMSRLDGQLSRLKARTRKVPFCGRLAVRMSAAEHLAPKKGWPRDASVCCRVVVHTPGARDGDVHYLETQAKTIDRQTGAVSWQDEQLAFSLTAEPLGVSLELYSIKAESRQVGRRRSVTVVPAACAAQTAGDSTVSGTQASARQLIASVALDLHPLAWCPYPHWRDVEVGLPCKNWHLLGSFPQKPSVALLRLGLQYSFTRVNVVCNTATLVSTDCAMEFCPGQLLDVATQALLAAMDPHMREERAAVQWLVEEYGSMTGLTPATCATTHLRRLMPYASLDHLWLEDVAQALEVLSTHRAVMLTSEIEVVQTVVEQLWQLVVALFVTFDISFPAALLVDQGHCNGHAVGLTAVVRMFTALVQLRDAGTDPYTEFVGCLETHAERLVCSTKNTLGTGSDDDLPTALNGLQWVYLCKVVCNELSELPVYSDYMTPLVPPKSSLRCILAAVYHRIMREVAKTLDLTAAGGAREARVSAAALNEALLDAGDSELSPIDL